MSVRSAPLAGPVFGEMRRAAGLTRRELAARLDCSEATIYRLEVPHCGPTSRFVRRLAAVELERAIVEQRVCDSDNTTGGQNG